MSDKYSEVEYYSLIYDSMCLRVSVSDGRTGEFFAVVPISDSGKVRREGRQKALDAIESAIDSGLPPGEVLI